MNTPSMGRGPMARWQSGAHRTLFWLCAVCLGFYFSYVLFLARSPLFAGGAETVATLFFFVVFAGLALGALLLFCRRWQGLSWLRAEKEKLDVRFFLLCMGVSLLILGVGLLACYPGASIYDNYNQWHQAHTGQYNDWHPAFHTLLMWLGTRVVDEYPWLVFLQILCFSAALSYLMSTLKAWGLPGWLLALTAGLISASECVGNVLMYPGKDNAMTLGIMVGCAQMVNVYFSRGKWLAKPLHAVLLGLALAFATLVRHNAFFFTAPLALCLLLCYRAQIKAGLLAVGVGLLCVLLVTGPLYGALSVRRPDNGFEESVGVPMTILLDMRLKNPEEMDGETQAFLWEFMTDEDFAKYYRKGNYNSVKFIANRTLLPEADREAFFGMVLDAVRNDPENAFVSYNDLTDLVWGVDGKDEATMPVANEGYLKQYLFADSPLNRFGAAAQHILRAPLKAQPLRFLFMNIGVQLALLLVAGLWSLYRAGPRALVLCLPVLLYDLGTMLLLCGNDARFFQFSMVISLPLVLALCQRLPNAPNTDC